VVHCTSSPQNTTVASIQNYWKNTLKWRNPGYHIIIDAAGKEHRLAPDSSVTNGVAGHNSNSLHVSYIGGVDGKRAVDNRTPQQKESLLKRVTEWKKLYPSAKIQGHRDFLKKGVNWKDCPSFDAKVEYKNV